jgi:hypothetical protein
MDEDDMNIDTEYDEYDEYDDYDDDGNYEYAEDYDPWEMGGMPDDYEPWLPQQLNFIGLLLLNFYESFLRRPLYKLLFNLTGNGSFYYRYIKPPIDTLFYYGFNKDPDILIDWFKDGFTLPKFN